MKTFKTSIENFVTDSMTLEEMNFLKGGGTDNPIDLVVHPK